MIRRKKSRVRSVPKEVSRRGCVPPACKLNGRAWSALLLLVSAVCVADTRSPELWRSRGYGLVARLDAGEATFYDVTRTTCVAHHIYDSAKVFEHASWSAGRRQAITTSPWGLTTWRFDRIAALPPPCLIHPADPRSPVYNFEVFWSTFHDQYAYMERRGVDWDAIGVEYRSKVNAATTDRELLDVFRAMLRQLQDRHTMIITDTARINDALPGTIARWYEEFDRAPNGSRDDVPKKKLVEYLTPAWNRYLDPGSVKQVSANVSTGAALGGRVGYVSIAAESGYAHSDGLGDDLSAARAEFEQVFAGFAGAEALILDLRLNQGGSDEVGLMIAGMLTASDREGFSKCARDGNGFTATQRTRVHASAHAFRGPVVVLTSPLTASAAENLAMIIKDFPNVVLLGDRTAGVHSDPLIKKLPNGWRFTLSNEAFTAPDGFDYEAVGTRPDILVPFEPEIVRNTGIDPALDKALHLLGSGRFAKMAGPLKLRKSPGRPSICRL